MQNNPLSPQELDHLVERVQGSDAKAFDELIRVVEREVRVFISSRSSSLEMVDEVLQNTLVTGFENIHAYELRGTFLAWLKGIARNHLARALHERSRYLAVEPDELERLVVEHRLQGIESEEDNQERDRVAQADEMRLNICMGRLTARSRLLLERRYKDRIPVKQLAQQFKQSLDAIAGTLKRIRGILRECLELAGARA